MEYFHNLPASDTQNKQSHISKGQPINIKMRPSLNISQALSVLELENGS